MPSHMSTIGFPVKTNEDFSRLARQTLELGETLESPGGSYYVWSPGAGIELWAQRDEQGKLIGLNPHFSSKARMRVGLTERIHNSRSSALDGAFYAWAGVREDTPDFGDHPLVFDVPDYRTHDALQLPRIAVVQLAAFAHHLTAYADEEAFQAKGSSMASEAFIPSGTFTPDGKAIDPPKALAIFNGHVLETARLTNSHTGQSFYWARVRTFRGEFDVVADPEVVKGTLIDGGVVEGDYWISGRLL